MEFVLTVIGFVAVFAVIIVGGVVLLEKDQRRIYSRALASKRRD